MKNKKSKRSYIRLLAIFLIVAVVIFAVSASLYNRSHSQQNNDSTKSSSIESSKETSSSGGNSSSLENAQSSQSEQKYAPANLLIGQGFRSSLKSVDGLSPEEAISKFHLPPAIVHDGTSFYYFADSDTVLHTSLGAYGAKGHYTMDGQNVMITYEGGNTLPLQYQVIDGKVVFNDFTRSVGGHTYDYNIASDPGAKFYIENKEQR
ncbi:hypothetical protein OZX65_06465 [Leuconostocaceae bacterium ESL0723]|nr:hypothetical protein OZX65_06465 [Leuconostocaceae bacterium ESL0723]